MDKSFLARYALHCVRVLRCLTQIRPQLNVDIGGQADGIYLIIASLGTTSDGSFDFINGVPFLERFYFLQDTSDPFVGLAETPNTFAIIN